jgi:hypothetical protein
MVFTSTSNYKRHDNDIYVVPRCPQQIHYHISGSQSHGDFTISNRQCCPCCNCVLQHLSCAIQLRLISIYALSSLKEQGLFTHAPLFSERCCSSFSRAETGYAFLSRNTLRQQHTCCGICMPHKLLCLSSNWTPGHGSAVQKTQDSFTSALGYSIRHTDYHWYISGCWKLGMNWNSHQIPYRPSLG